MCAELCILIRMKIEMEFYNCKCGLYLSKSLITNAMVIGLQYYLPAIAYQFVCSERSPLSAVCALWSKETIHNEASICEASTRVSGALFVLTPSDGGHFAGGRLQCRQHC